MNFENSLPLNSPLGSNNSVARGFEDLATFSHSTQPAGNSSNQLQPTHFSSNMFSKKKPNKDFADQIPALSGKEDAIRDASEQLRQDFSSCPFPSAKQPDSTQVSLGTKSCPQFKEEMLQEPPNWGSSVPAPCYDHVALEEFRCSFGTKVSALGQIYDDLDQRGSSGERDSSFLGLWLNAAEFKSSLITDILKEFLIQLRGQRSDIDELKRAVKDADENALAAALEQKTASFDVERRWNLKTEALTRRIVENGETSKVASARVEQLTADISEWTQSMDKRFEEVKLRLDQDLNCFAGPIKDLQLRCGELSELATKTLGFSQNSSSDLQAKYDLLLRDLSTASALALKASEIGQDCTSELQKVISMSGARNFSLSEGSAQEDMNLIRLRLERLETSLASTLAAQSSTFEELMRRTGLNGVLVDISSLSRQVNDYHLGNCAFKMEMSQKVQDISNSCKALCQEHKERYNVYDSRLLAMEVQMQDLLQAQRFAPSIHCKADASNISDLSQSSKVGGNKEVIFPGNEFNYYKGKVDSNIELTQQVVEEFRVWRKDLGLLIRRFESFCVNDLSSGLAKGVDLSIYESFKTCAVDMQKVQTTSGVPSSEVPNQVNNKGKKKHKKKKNKLPRESVTHSKGENQAKKQSHQGPNSKTTIKVDNSGTRRTYSNHSNLTYGKAKESLKQDGGWIFVGKNHKAKDVARNDVQNKWNGIKPQAPPRNGKGDEQDFTNRKHANGRAFRYPNPFSNGFQFQYWNPTHVGPRLPGFTFPAYSHCPTAGFNASPFGFY